MTRRPILIAHLSDLHLDGTGRKRDRVRSLMRCLHELAQPVDAIVVTGDIADHGLAAEYEEASAMLSSGSRVMMCPGNHDNRATYRQILLGEAPADRPINSSATVGGVRFLLCDSTVPGKACGYLADETIAWLDSELARESAAPTLICFHHPPTILHSPFIDEMRQRGEERLADVVRRHSNIAAILCGHAHTAAATTFAGRPLLVAPGVSSTLRLPWEHGEPWTIDTVLDFALPPSFAFHVIDGDRPVTTHYRVVACQPQD